MQTVLARLQRLPGLASLHVEQELGGGPLSHKWLLAAGEGRYVLRIDRPLAGRLGMDRHGEEHLLQLLAARGFAYAPVWADPDAGVLLQRFVAAAVWESDKFHRHDCLIALGRRLRQLHSLPPEGPPMDLPARLACYAAVAASPAATALQSKAVAWLRECSEGRFPQAICHNDAVAGNVLATEPPSLIDWEYAAVGDPRFDLAVVAGHHGLDQEAMGWLLESYNYPEKQYLVSISELQRWVRLYGMVSTLWNMAIRSHGVHGARCCGETWQDVTV